MINSLRMQISWWQSQTCLTNLRSMKCQRKGSRNSTISASHNLNNLMKYKESKSSKRGPCNSRWVPLMEAIRWTLLLDNSEIKKDQSSLQSRSKTIIYPKWLPSWRQWNALQETITIWPPYHQWRMRSNSRILLIEIRYWGLLQHINKRLTVPLKESNRR